MPLSVKDGMGAWIKDFQKSDAPQFKGKSEKDRREMAIAAYLSAKRGSKPQDESVEENVSAPQTAAHRRAMMVGVNRAKENKPPFDPDPKKPATKNSDKTTTSPMSRAKQLAKMARDRGMKKEDTQLEEMYASTTEPHKDGHRPKVVKTHPDGKTTMSYLGQHVYKSKEHARNAADHIAKGMRKGRASDSYIDDFARRHHKEHGMKEAYRPPTQAEIDADKRKENRGKSRPSMTAKSATRNVYKNYMGGLKKESAELDEAKYGFFGTDNPKIGDAVKHRNGASGKVKKIETQGDETWVHFKDKNGVMNSGRWKKSVTPTKESVELEEAHAYSKAANALRDYANKHGGMDKADFHTAAKHLDNIGKAGLMQKGQHLAKMNNHFKGLDTDVRDRIHMTLKQHGVMEAVQVDELSPATHKSYQAKAYSDAAKGMAKKRMGTMSSKDAYDNEVKRYKGIDTSKYLNRKHHGVKEENLDELKKSTLGNYVKVAAKDAASKAYGAASAAKDNRADQAGKDFSKSMKRLRGIDTATKKLAKEDVEEAKSFDQKFKDHLKFATSKSPAVQAHLKKRKDARDAAHAKQDPSAVNKNYGPAVIPPGTAYNKARKRGMNPSQAASAVSTAFKNRAKGGKLPG